jgi:hypothetical protein
MMLKVDKRMKKVGNISYIARIYHGAPYFLDSSFSKDAPANGRGVFIEIERANI